MAVAGVVVALILVSVVVALVNPRGAAETLSEDTPEGIVQQFILAVQDRDYSLAHSYLSDELKKTCTITQMEERSYWPVDTLEDNRIALLDTEELSDGRVRVRVRVTQVNVSPPFGMNEYSHEERYVLAQENGNWRLVEPPWPLSWCSPPATPAKSD
ncbi:MAG: hypothetical protein HY672_00040 [Chloroflexi bacterium]|nr:hypothetical protein [Chloroflexota bacterium]